MVGGNEINSILQVGTEATTIAFRFLESDSLLEI